MLNRYRLNVTFCCDESCIDEEFLFDATNMFGAIKQIKDQLLFVTLNDKNENAENNIVEIKCKLVAFDEQL